MSRAKHFPGFLTWTFLRKNVAVFIDALGGRVGEIVFETGEACHREGSQVKNLQPDWSASVPLATKRSLKYCERGRSYRIGQVICQPAGVQRENSDVFASRSVAVAVICQPLGTAGAENVKVAVQDS